MRLGLRSLLCTTPAPTQIQDLAIRCVQKNIKKNKGVKDWPWWKLFTTVRPLIEVQLSEEQIRNKDVRNSPGRAKPMGEDRFIRVGKSLAGLSWAPKCSLFSPESWCP